MRRQKNSLTPQQDIGISVNSMLNVLVWFNNFYTSNKRVFFHLLMWLFFGALVEFGLLIDYHLNIYSSLFFLGRTLIGNMVVFYMFFYIILPRFILKKRFLLGLGLTIGALFIWRIIEYFSMILTARYANISSTSLVREVREEVELGFYYVFSPEKFMGGLIFILYSLSPLFCIKIVIDVIKSAFQTTEIEKGKAALEVAFLKSQLNPHFLFNTLNTIYILNRKNDSAASDVILELSDTLRYTLYESNTEQVILENELNFLRNYVELEKARHNKQTKIEFNCDLSDIGTLTIAPLLTFPFIENAFKHGLGTTLKNAWLIINISIKNSIFHFDIQNSKDDENNGIQLEDSIGGIGIANTKRRLALLYPGKYTLEIENTTDIYKISLKIDLE